MLSLTWGSLYWKNDIVYIEAAPCVFIYTSRRKQNDHNFTTGISVTEGICILIQIRQKFVSKGPIDNMYELIQVMARHPTYYNSLPEPMST